MSSYRSRILQEQLRLEQLRAQQQLNQMGGPVTYVTDDMSFEEQRRQIELQRQKYHADMAEAQDRALRQRRYAEERKAKQDKRSAERAAERAAERRARLREETLRSAAMRKLTASKVRRLERREEFLTPWTRFRVWFWGLLGVSSYETIRTLLQDRARRRNPADNPTLIDVLGLRQYLS